VSGRHEWLNRDPIGEMGGINLYDYVANDPVNKVDPLGLQFMGFPVGPGSGSSIVAQGQALYQQQNPSPTVPYPLNNSFSAGITGTLGYESGNAFGAGGQFSGGLGLFWNPQSGLSLGTFLSVGGFLGGPGASINYPKDPCKKSGVFGSYYGLGGGGWLSNAGSSSDLLGPFNQANLNTPLVSVSPALSGNTYIVSFTGGVGMGGSLSSYPTTTFNASSLNLFTGTLNSQWSW